MDQHYSLNKLEAGVCLTWTPYGTTYTMGMDKLQLTGRNLGRVFYFISCHLQAVQFWFFSEKLLELKLKNRPKQLQDSLPLVFALPIMGQATNLEHYHYTNPKILAKNKCTKKEQNQRRGTKVFNCNKRSRGYKVFFSPLTKGQNKLECLSIASFSVRIYYSLVRLARVLA